MKITRDTPDQLILENTPWVLGSLLIAGALGCTAFAMFSGAWFMLIGTAITLIMAGLVTRRTMVIFHGPETYFEVRRRTVLGLAVERHDLGVVTEAVVQTNAGGKNTTYNVGVKLGDADTVPLTRVSDSFRGRHELTAKRINNWLADHDAT
ncbi:MAG: hypothetical protein AAFR35_02390 [Pseudomonadota bacterium]